MGLLVVCAIADTWYDIVPTNVETEIQNKFTFNEVTGELLYDGLNDMDFSINLSCSVDSSVVNTIIHIGIKHNGIIDEGTVSGTKVESSTAINSLNIASAFESKTNDTFKIQIKANKICTVDVFHIQSLIMQYKKYLEV